MEPRLAGGAYIVDDDDDYITVVTTHINARVMQFTQYVDCLLLRWLAEKYGILKIPIIKNLIISLMKHLKKFMH